MSAAHDLPFYIVTETGEVWVTNDSGNGTVSTYYGKHDVVVQELHTRLAYLEQELHDIEKMRCPVCNYPAPENEKEWPNSECVVCTLSAENERLEQQNARLTRELSEAREAIYTAPIETDGSGCYKGRAIEWFDLPAVRAVIEEGKR